MNCFPMINCFSELRLLNCDVFTHLMKSLEDCNEMSSNSLSIFSDFTGISRKYM